MDKLTLTTEQARQLAVGLYRQIAAYIESADMEDYEKFKSEFLAKKEDEKSAVSSIKRRRNKKA